jgi:SpoVK/Ycf46/Vps4 family AAA+-type ATPase
LFSPSLLVIDDLDFIAGEREDNPRKNPLGEFLQALDGLLPNNVFVLASTNDKKLVDAAAQRPGRFDMILDIAEIESNNYLQLIRRETKDTEIIKLFDDETLIYLRDKKVTGAFIVSLIKQVNNAIQINGKLSKTEFLDYLDLAYKGFYDFNEENFKSAIGFNK